MHNIKLDLREVAYADNRTHYTIIQSTVWYDTQLTNDSLTTLIVFRSRNYIDSFFSCIHLFSDIPSSDNAFSICAGFASDRIGRVYVNSTNMHALGAPRSILLTLKADVNSLQLFAKIIKYQLSYEKPGHLQQYYLCRFFPLLDYKFVLLSFILWFCDTCFLTFYFISNFIG